MWVAWFRTLPVPAPGPAPSAAPEGPAVLRLEVRLWGFPRADAARLCRVAADLSREFGGALANAEVALPDPDTLVVRSPLMVAHGPDALPYLGPYLSLATAPELEAVCCQFRLRINDEATERDPDAGRANTLVLAGAARDGGFLLRSAWPTGRRGEDEALYESAVWPDETKLYAALYDWKAERRTPPDWVTTNHATLFPNRSASALSAVVIWFLNPGGSDSSGKRGGLLAPTLLRLFVSGSAIVGSAALISAAVPRSWGLAAGGVPPLLIALLGFGFTAFMAWTRVTTTHRMMRAANQRLYSQPSHHTPTDLSLQPGVLEESSVRKLSHDIEAAGATHALDFQLDPSPAGRFVSRLFLLDRGETAFVTSFMFATGDFRVFPARPIFLLKTYLADGRYAVSINGGGGYSRRLRGVPVVARVFPGVADPAEMIARHRAFVSSLGSPPVATAPEEYLRRMEEEHERLRPLMAAIGYVTWETAFRQAFEMIRPEYLPDAPVPSHKP